MWNFSADGNENLKTDADAEDEKKGPTEAVSFLSLVCYFSKIF